MCLYLYNFHETRKIKLEILFLEPHERINRRSFFDLAQFIESLHFLMEISLNLN